MKKCITLIVTAVLLLSVTACGNEASGLSGETKEDNASAGKAVGESFQLGDETYALEKWVSLPEYDSDTMRGYGLCLVQKEGVAPIKINSSGYSSLIDAVLDLNGETVGTKNISFIKAEDAPGYAARVTFEFALPKDEALPMTGTVAHADTEEKQALDLSALAAPEPAAEETPEPAATEAPALSEEAQALLGKWFLTGVRFFTPDQDNGVYGIDGTLSFSDGYAFGQDLLFTEDGVMQSNINLAGLINDVNELPFTADDLDLSAYDQWSFADGLVLTAPDGPVLWIEESTDSKELRLTTGRMVEIQPIERDGAMTKADKVDIEITLILEPA
ncbi:MAG: hypothetical protein PHO41_08680 [Eubacteriales bacterium]|nr:hypothetical protein [Eubacteriales bacterium]